MVARKIYEDIKKLLEKHHQDHLLGFWDELDTAQRQHLLSQINQLDLEKIDYWVTDYIKKTASDKISSNLAPAPFYSYEPSDQKQQRKYAKAVKLGKELIQQGKVAAFVVAGGQGTEIFQSAPSKTKPCFESLLSILQSPRKNTKPSAHGIL